MKTLTKYVATGIVTLSLAGVAFAASDFSGNAKPPQSFQKQDGKFHKHKKPCKQFNKRAYMNSFPVSWKVALHHARQLTPAQAKTVADAAVILYGDSDMKVASVKAIQGRAGHQNYQVQVTNDAGKTVGTFAMDGVTGKLIPPKVKMLPLQPASN